MSYSRGAYRTVKINGKHIPEHRFVMEQLLQRKLRTGEVVHHINGKCDDNRIENLMLFSNSRKHITYHMKTAPEVIEARSIIKPAIFRSREVMEILDISKKELLLLEKSEKLKPVYLRKYIKRYLAEDIEKLINRKIV